MITVFSNEGLSQAAKCYKICGIWALVTNHWQNVQATNGFCWNINLGICDT